MYSVVLLAALSGSGDLPAADALPAYPNGGCTGNTVIYGDCTGNGRHGRFFGKFFHRNHGGGCFGCNGGGVGAPVVAPALPNATVPVLPATPTTPATPAAGKKVTDVSGRASAQIVVDLPADARLFLDGELTKSTTARRTLTTPVLEAGRSYSYTLLAEVVRDGKIYSVSKLVAVTAGETTSVSFAGLGGALEGAGKSLTASNP